MSKVLKWTLIVLGILAGLGLLATLGYAWYFSSQGGHALWRGPMEYGWSPRMEGWHPRPMMLPTTFLPLNILFFFGNLLKWLFLAALLYGAYWLGRISVTSVTSSPSQPVTPSQPEDLQPERQS